MIRRRLFYALWPPDIVRNEIDSIFTSLAEVNGKRIAYENLHITLLFLGNILEDTANCIESINFPKEERRFELILNTLGYFPKSQILWLGSKNYSSELTKLFNYLKSKVIPCAVTVEDCRYQPHLTLFRKVAERPCREIEIHIPWLVEHFYLVESITSNEGSKYRIIKRYSVVNFNGT